MSEELRIDIKSMTLPELTALMKDWGEPGFRAGQLFSWLHEKRVRDWSEMTNLSAALRQKLAERCTLTQLTVLHRLVSSIDGTQKYLYRLADGNCIETVLMKYRHGNSLCISTQVGCRMGCNFCASTLGGLVRHLTPSEMLEQVYETVRQSGERVDSLVLMGIGEPLDNYDNVIRSCGCSPTPRDTIWDSGTSPCPPADWWTASTILPRRIWALPCPFPCMRRTMKPATRPCR